MSLAVFFAGVCIGYLLRSPIPPGVSCEPATAPAAGATGEDAPVGESEAVLPDLSCPGCSLVLLNVELLRPDYVGLTNPKVNYTPNIDSFFNGSIIFEDVTSPAGETLRSNSAVQTGLESMLFNLSTQMYAEMARTRKYDPLFLYPSAAQKLQRLGFYTVLINENIRGGRNVELERGFDEDYEYPSVSPVDVSRGSLLNVLDHVSDRRSYVLYQINTLNPQSYIYPTGRSRIEHPSIVYQTTLYRGTNNSLKVSLNKTLLSRNESRKVAGMVYAQELGYVDDELLPIFERLSEDYLNDTIIVLYSNHGDGLYDNGISVHGVGYQSCVHTTLLIRHPKVRGPIRVSRPVALLDLMPTLFDMMGVNESMAPFAESMVPLIVNGTYGRRYIFGRDDQDFYVRSGDWKYIVAGTFRKELYNIRNDPGETKNLILQNREISMEMEMALDEKKMEVLEFKSRLENGTA